MTGFDSKRQAAQAKLDDDADTLTIVYQRGFADGKMSAERKPLTDEEIMNIAKVSCIGVSPQEDTLNFAKVIEAVHGIKGEA